ncbi:MAG: hypothetical protein ACK4TA_05605 [Saprospiraceae bacterium]
MIDVIFRYATRRNVLIFMGITLLGMFVLFPLLQNRLENLSGGYGFLDLMFPAFTIDDAYARLEAYGEEGRAYHSTIHLTADLLFPLIYGVAYALLIAFFWDGSSPRRGWVRYLPLLPFLATIADYAENILIGQMFSQFPDQSNALYRSAGSATFLKWTFQFLSISVAAIGLLLFVARRTTPDVQTK